MFKFGNLDSFKNDVGRNTFDMSFGTNATFKMGKLYPVFIKDVLPRDTWRIDSKVAIQMMPTIFPLKTRLRCFVHFFYVKNRTLWKDWQKFINNSYGMGNENYNIVPPFIQHDYDKALHGTGSLADFLGWPTALASPQSTQSESRVTRSSSLDRLFFNELRDNPIFSYSENDGYSFMNSIFDLTPGSLFNTSIQQNILLRTIIVTVNEQYRDKVSFNGLKLEITKRYYPETVAVCAIGLSNFSNNSGTVVSVDQQVIDVNTTNYNLQLSGECNALAIQIHNTSSALIENHISFVDLNNQGVNPHPIGSYDFEVPWWNGMNINALPFRAYEAVYNAYYRNWQADPLLDDRGRPNYDTYVRNVEGGADSNDYDFYLRNYEKDMFTSAHPTPQMGVAPLVGISTLGSATFSVDGTEYNLQAQFEDDNETIKDFKMTSSVPNSVALAATNLQGISINDLRSVNALQRYLENGVRASYKYRNQIAAHFGAAPEFDTVDMPLFIGGIATDLGQNVTQTTASYSDSLGNEIPAGTPISNGYFAYDGKDTIEKYCDEHGFIIGILSIVPIPNYPQGLSPMWRKEDYMRYYTPEMGHLGYQPIRSNEISLFRQLDDKTGQVIPDSEVFGYQRSWYEHCGSNDEVHGEFRTTMRDYMLSRWFSEIPKLDPEFIGVDSNKLSYIFADTNDNDKFVGQLYFSAFAKRPIPEYGTPKLD